jgi:hypothetical protein
MIRRCPNLPALPITGVGLAVLLPTGSDDPLTLSGWMSLASTDRTTC